MDSILPKTTTLQASHHEAIIIGGGPKGIAMQLELTQCGINSILLESRSRTGRSWTPQHINNRMPVTPMGIEITRRPGFTIGEFMARQSEAQIKATPLNRGFITAKHFRDYLDWLSKRIEGIHADVHVQQLHTHGAVFEVLSEGGQRFSAPNVVLATGLIGYGRSEFIFDPTDLLGKSPLIAHNPGTIVTQQEVTQFIGDAQRVSIIGGGPAFLHTLSLLMTIPTLKEIRIIATQMIEGFHREAVCSDRAVAQAMFENIQESNGSIDVIFQEQTELVSAEEKDGSLKLELSAEDGRKEVTTDRVILATGFKYNFTRLPFLEKFLTEVNVCLTQSQRYPRVTQDHEVITSKGSIQLFMLGEGALDLGLDQRLLPSAIASVEKIARVVCS